VTEPSRSTSVVTVAGGLRDTAPPWTLARLGHGPIDFAATAEPSAAHVVNFTLPKKASQGGTTWYLLRVHYRVEIDPKSGPGRVYVMGAVNGHAAAMQTYVVRRDAEELSVHSTELGLVSGFKARTTRSLVDERTFENFIPYKGVLPGAGTISFAIEQHDEARIRRVRVFPDSGVFVKRAGPASLVIEPTVHDRVIRAGSTFVLDYRIVNRGGQPVSGARLTVAPLGLLAVAGSKQIELQPIAPGASLRGRIRVRAQADGTWPLVLTAESSFGSASSTLNVRVLR
jgi:hypothetical protein